MLLNNGTKTGFMLFFLQFSHLPCLLPGRKIKLKDKQGSNRDINCQFNSNLRLCQQ